MKKTPGTESLTGESYQIFKEEEHLLEELFQTTEKKKKIYPSNYIVTTNRDSQHCTRPTEKRKTF